MSLTRSVYYKRRTQEQPGAQGKLSGNEHGAPMPSPGELLSPHFHMFINLEPLQIVSYWVFYGGLFHRDDL